MSKSPKLKMSYILTMSVVTFTRYSLIPWLLWDLNNRKYDSWTKAVQSYGWLLSGLQCGHALGQLLISLNITDSILYSLAFFLLSCAYIALCFIDRFSLVFILVSTIGFAGSVLSSVSINLDKTLSNVSFIRKPNEVELSNNTERTIICFLFSTLISGYLYDSDPFTRFPMHRISILVGVVCCMIVLYFVYIGRTVQRKWRSTAHKYGSVSSSSLNNDANNTNVVPAINFTGSIPANFIVNCNGNVAAAQLAYNKRLQWRLDEKIDQIMDTPQPGFDNMMKFYPHAIHGYSLDGCAVVYELLGQASTSNLLASGVTITDLVRHMVLRNELVFERLTEPSYIAEVRAKYPEAFDQNLMNEKNPNHIRKLMSILDLKDVSLGSFNQTVITFIAQSGNVVDTYFPKQVERLVMCNAPSWLRWAWSGISTALPTHVTNKIVIQSGVDGLSEFIHHSQRSKLYGGTDPVDVGYAPGHKAFLQLAENWKNGKSNGVTPLATTSVASAVKGINASVSSSSSTTNKAFNSKEIESYSAVGDQVASVHRPTQTSPKSRGILGWLSGKSTATEAHMGGRNDFQYDVKSGQWKQAFELDDDEDGYDTEVSFEPILPAAIKGNTSIIMSHSQDAYDQKGVDKNKKKGSPKRQHGASTFVKSEKEVLEDHAIQLALNIAQTVDLEAGRRGALSSGPVRQSSKELSKLSKFNNSTSSSSLPTLLHNNGGVVMTDEEQRASWGLFVLVGGMHVVSVLTQGTLFTLLPVYLVGAVSTAGLSYSVHDLTLVLSATAMCVLHWHIFFSLRLEYCLKASPVRTLRIGCGILIVLCFLLPMYLNITTYNTHSAAAMLVATSTPLPQVVNSNIRGGVVYDAVISPRDTHLKIPRDSHLHLFHAAGGNIVNYNPPSHNVATLLMTSFLVSVVVVASHMCRKASNILFHLTLNSTFRSSTSLRCITNHLLDIAAPLIACYWLRSRHNSAFFLSLMAFVMLPVYIASTFLGVQFRGDYGVMTDNQGGAAIGGGQSSAALNHILPSHQHGQQQQDVLSVPFGDLSLLFSQIGYSYGSKLYNLRDDFKDL